MRRLVEVVAVVAAAIAFAPSRAQPEAGDARASFMFAVAGSNVADGERRAVAPLRAIGDSPAAFVVHFDLSTASRESCSLVHLVRLRDVLETSAKPVVPVVSASQWSNCDGVSTEADERLARVGDTFFGGDESLGQARLRWVRQSAVPRFHRYRENVRWQTGNVLFVAINLPDNNNNYRLAAGRNGEFEERSIANRIWLERSFRIAAERRLAGIVLFVDAAPRFGLPMRPPDSHSRERDGFYEWKLALRELVGAFRGQVLLVQSRLVAEGRRPPDLDHPLRDEAGKPLTNFARIALSDGTSDTGWLRIEVEPKNPALFNAARAPLFDDPSGELYGPARVR